MNDELQKLLQLEVAIRGLRQTMWENRPNTELACKFRINQILEGLDKVRGNPFHEDGIKQLFQELRTECLEQALVDIEALDNSYASGADCPRVEN